MGSASSHPSAHGSLPETVGTFLALLRNDPDRAGRAFLAAIGPVARAIFRAWRLPTDLTEDAVQDGMLRALANDSAALRRADPGTHLAAWLRGLMHNLAHEQVRRRRRLPSHPGHAERPQLRRRQAIHLHAQRMHGDRRTRSGLRGLFLSMSDVRVPVVALPPAPCGSVCPRVGLGWQTPQVLKGKPRRSVRPGPVSSEASSGGATSTGRDPASGGPPPSSCRPYARRRRMPGPPQAALSRPSSRGGA